MKDSILLMLQDAIQFICLTYLDLGFMKNVRRINIGSLLLSACLMVGAQNVSVSTAPLTLPTYELGPADPHPIFFTGRVYQGAQGNIYPYPLYDVLTDNKVDKTYKAVYLENKYVKVCMLPEIGGRILSATDKTDGYELFYRQTGIKPALIGMLGAWLSGGVEWNLPHHHRASSYMPIDWRTEGNPDGSKTIWVGETELTERLKWSIGITLYPDRSWVEARVRIINQTPFIQSLLYWANVSVHCNENYQVIFPPSTQFGADHSKVYFTRWPYGESERGKGDKVDLSWWKNFTSTSRSVFCWNFDDDFLAGYDHGTHAGTVHVANHNIVTGKKFFLWGNNSSARMWDKMLSDNDGPYLELMVGAYSDNQPDYSWIGPGETHEFTQRWYGLRDIESVKNANDDAAVNLERKSPTKAFIGFNASTAFNGAKVLLLRNNKVVFSKIVDISPDKPFTAEIKVPKETKDEELKAELLDASGKELVSYQPVRLQEQPMPKVIDGTKPVKDYKTVEELYFAGLRVEQFHNARLDAMDFYNEALRRDSLDSRVNTVVGIHYARQGNWKEDEKYLKRALVRPTHDYTRAKDNEPYYYLGMTYQMTGRLKEAKDAYWRATWYPTFQHPAYLALAQIACRENDYHDALDLVNRSLNVGMNDTKAQTLKGYILRKLGEKDKAAKALENALKVDPLDYWSLSEKSQLSGEKASFLAKADEQRGTGLVRTQELLEMATEYITIGAWQETVDLLDAALNVGKPYSDCPLVYYYAAYAQWNLGNKREASQLWQSADKLSTDFSFPFRLEEVNILKKALDENSNDAHAAYYLGNLYYFLGQKDLGLKYWELSRDKGADFAEVYRNLGFGYGRLGKTNEAVAEYEKAFRMNPQDPRYLRELDIMYEKAGKPVAERLNILENNLFTVMKHDEDVMRLLTLYNETGNYDKAIVVESSRHFHVWEGGGEIHSIYADSHMLKGMSLLKQKNYNDAIKEFSAADEYPDNLEVGRPEDGTFNAKTVYFTGKAWQALGNRQKAEECFRKAASVSVHEGTTSENSVFKALALKETGKQADAGMLLGELNSSLENIIEGKSKVDAYSKFGEDGSNKGRIAQAYYLRGLIQKLSGDGASANEDLRKSMDLKPSAWAKLFLDM